MLLSNSSEPPPLDLAGTSRTSSVLSTSSQSGLPGSLATRAESGGASGDGGGSTGLSGGAIAGELAVLDLRANIRWNLP